MSTTSFSALASYSTGSLFAHINTLPPELRTMIHDYALLSIPDSIVLTHLQALATYDVHDATALACLPSILHGSTRPARPGVTASFLRVNAVDLISLRVATNHLTSPLPGIDRAELLGQPGGGFASVRHVEVECTGFANLGGAWALDGLERCEDVRKITVRHRDELRIYFHPVPVEGEDHHTRSFVRQLLAGPKLREVVLVAENPEAAQAWAFCNYVKTIAVEDGMKVEVRIGSGDQ